MTKSVPSRSTIFAPVGRADGQLAGLLDLRLEELAWHERFAVARGDWATARSMALQRAQLREAHQRIEARGRA